MSKGKVYTVWEVDGVKVVTGQVSARELAHLLADAGSDAVVDAKLSVMMNAVAAFGPRKAVLALREAMEGLLAESSVVRVFYTSKWVEGEVRTLAKLDLDTGQVFSIQQSDEGERFELLIHDVVSPVSGGGYEALVEDQDVLPSKSELDRWNGKGGVKRIDITDEAFRENIDCWRVVESFAQALDRMCVEFPGFLEDDDVNGGDLVEWVGEHLLPHVHPMIDEMVDAFPGFAEDDDVNGGDLVEWVGEHLVPLYRDQVRPVLR